MSPFLNREFIAHALIAVAACIGAWMLLVEPRIAELAEIKQEIVQDRAQSNTSVVVAAHGAAGEVSTLRPRLREIESKNALATDSPRLYRIVMELAKKHQIEVRSLQPGTTSSGSGNVDGVVTRIELSAEGEYANAAAFLDEVNELPAFLRPTLVELSPRSERGASQVSLRFGCEIISFKIADALTALAGGDADAQP